jgi:hypothetical protein
LTWAALRLSVIHQTVAVLMLRQQVDAGQVMPAPLV